MLSRTTRKAGASENRDGAQHRLMSLRADVARYAKKMHDSGLVRATQGNLSARDPKSGLICVTPSGAEYDSLGAEDIVVVTADGELVEGRWKPSVEVPAHLAVYRRRADVGCIMHTHSIYATVFGVLYRPFPMILAESAYCLGGEVPIAPYQESGTSEFGEMASQLSGLRVSGHLGQPRRDGGGPYGRAGVFDRACARG